MSKLVLTDQKLLVAGYDFTSSINAINLDFSAEPKESTTMGKTSRTYLGGLKAVQLQAAGFFDATPVDKPIFDRIGSDGLPLSVVMGTSVGSVAYFFKAMAGEYSFGETIGEINKFNLGAGASEGPLVRGKLLNNSTVTATANGTGNQTGAVSATQYAYAAIHVTASSGSGNQTLNAIITSDDNGSFTSETTRFTFTQLTTAVGSQFMSLAGPITDDYWRAKFTVGGTGSPSFDVIVVLGVQ